MAGLLKNKLTTYKHNYLFTNIIEYVLLNDKNKILFTKYLCFSTIELFKNFIRINLKCKQNN